MYITIDETVKRICGKINRTNYLINKCDENDGIRVYYQGALDSLEFALELILKNDDSGYLEQIIYKEKLQRE